ncbi:hypothetical protein C8J57DRAFT_1522246 [Mycena rebaudengoi]|nr:hypothetical protein C8J57DRAFT_1525584 [Mycena rebaudengoi]KAJ7248780.1 hypothetical protein C8J57DRAFT_1522246 [Mycena rebaudengoi]
MSIPTCNNEGSVDDEEERSSSIIAVAAIPSVHIVIALVTVVALRTDHTRAQHNPRAGPFASNKTQSRIHSPRPNPHQGSHLLRRQYHRANIALSLHAVATFCAARLGIENIHTRNTLTSLRRRPFTLSALTSYT